MANYNKGGEIFIDLGGINVDQISTSNTNTVKIAGIYSRLETAINLGKRVVITNYVGQYNSKGVPTSVPLFRPTGTTFYIPVLAFSGISLLQILSSNAVQVNSLYGYHNINTPPETTTNNTKILEETIEEEEKGEESK